MKHKILYKNDPCETDKKGDQKVILVFMKSIACIEIGSIFCDKSTKYKKLNFSAQDLDNRCNANLFHWILFELYEACLNRIYTGIYHILICRFVS